MAMQDLVDTGFTGVRDLTNADHDFVSRVAFEIKGLTAAGASCTPQVKFSQGSGTEYNAQYTVVPTLATVTAGTAITADGIYEVICDACIVSLNITVGGSAQWSVYVTPLAG